MTHARTRVKFCGMAHPDDVDAAVALGVDALGFIFAESPRKLELEVARSLIARVPPFVTTVAVFVEPDDELFAKVSAIMPRMLPQFCGNETPERCAQLSSGPYLKVIHIDEASDRAQVVEKIAQYPGALPVFDTKIAGRGGGSGVVFDWQILPEPPLRGVIAGGLNPSNVERCVRDTRPFAVDVRSGIEDGARKDYMKMATFLANVRAADAAIKESL